MTYQEYIGSREWRENSVRLAEFRATGLLCRICSRGEGVTIKAYRRTYENLNHERPGDLTALCWTRHGVALGNPTPLFDPTFKKLI